MALKTVLSLRLKVEVQCNSLSSVGRPFQGRSAVTERLCRQTFHLSAVWQGHHLLMHAVRIVLEGWHWVLLGLWRI